MLDWSRSLALLLPKFNFWKGDWALGYISTQIYGFLRSHKSFGNSWGNSYTTIAILDTMFYFTCG